MASAQTNDTVWTAKSTGYIKSGDTLRFENYVITSNILDDTKALISVAKNQDLIETSVFRINDFKKYDTTGITLLGIKGNYSFISVSRLENKDVWLPLERKILKWGDNYSINNYTMFIDTFASDPINLTIYNRTMTRTHVLSINDVYDLENLRIVLRDINRTGFIELEFLTNGLPPVKAEIITDKNEYFPDEKIKVIVNIINGSEYNILSLFLNSSSPVVIAPDLFSIRGNSSASFSSQITQLPVNTTFAISANIETWDYFNRTSIITIRKDVQITHTVAIIKYVPSETDDENVSVRLYVRNSDLKNHSIHVHDNIPPELKAKELDWDIEIGAGNSTNLTYFIRPQKPVLYLLPQALVTWDGYSTVSKNVEMTMHMPYISINKTAETNKSVTNVKLFMKNMGDRPAIVNMIDKKPDVYQLIGGSLEWSGKLEPGESYILKYSLKGRVESLPFASASYRDIRGIIRTARSNSIEPANPVSTPDENRQTSKIEPSDIMKFMVQSFITITVIISAAFIIIYLYTKMKKG